MPLSNIVYNPLIRTKDSTTRVMLDVVIALVPCLVISYLAFGAAALSLVAVSVGSAMVAEYLFSLIFLHRTDSLGNFSAVVTGLLLAFTLGAFTPLYVVAFGSAAAVIFGKLLWGGLGTNRFNPALVGREFMTVFFPSVMTSGTIWYNQAQVNFSSFHITGSDFFNQLFFKPSGALGEYSIIFLIVGGLYLLLRRRISWHIPFSLFLVFTIGLFVSKYIAPDMASSASTPWGKCYYGAMIGLSAVILVFNGVRYEYMSYSILLLNGFSGIINWICRPRIWGDHLNVPKRLSQVLLLTVIIVLATFAIIKIHELGGIQYLIYVYILYCIIRFIIGDIKGSQNIK
ncbi:RnfABCDGE type electron transport complex subunit D [Prevotella cerevisiae]|uniref:RnfABCDGE type electron transport complex subunit D n=1 Tax=Segatella cerevisiae TaxID=2053716 RepID=A0ABT1BX58_9BACT|nr:RnfABCDGE type electron transport complex subunit D [Segatella cerevisiae]MCO6025657.1 RnfABCDGE type electron transport complex subunit D [Segatella cerevisiae]